MKLINELNNFYYKMSMYELQCMSKKDYYNGLSYNSMLYINVILQMPDCTVSKIAEALSVTKSAVTLKINELEKLKAVEKVQSNDDKRVFYIRLSQTMSKSVGIYDAVFNHVEKELNKQFTNEQLEAFNEVLQTISNYEWRKIDHES